MIKATLIIYYEKGTDLEKYDDRPFSIEDCAIYIKNKCIRIYHQNIDDYGDKIYSNSISFLKALKFLGLIDCIKKKKVIKKDNLKIKPRKLYNIKDVLQKEFYSNGYIPPYINVGEKMRIDGEDVIVSITIDDLENGITDSHREIANKSLNKIKEWTYSKEEK